jgi:hypothetical protein
MAVLSICSYFGFIGMIEFTGVVKERRQVKSEKNKKTKNGKDFACLCDEHENDCDTGCTSRTKQRKRK